MNKVGTGLKVSLGGNKSNVPENGLRRDQTVVLGAATASSKFKTNVIVRDDHAAITDATKVAVHNPKHEAAEKNKVRLGRMLSDWVADRNERLTTSGSGVIQRDGYRVVLRVKEVKEPNNQLRAVRYAAAILSQVDVSDMPPELLAYHNEQVEYLKKMRDGVDGKFKFIGGAIEKK